MFLYSHWCALSITTRHKLASEFGIIKKGSTEVFDNQIKHDGYVIKDIESALTLDAIQKYLGTTETDLQILWGWLVDKIEGRGIITPEILHKEFKSAQASEIKPTVIMIPKSFCDTCDSKGARHKKGCPKNK